MPVTTEQMTLALNIPPSAPPHVYAAAAEQCLQWGRPDGALKVSQLGLDRHPAYTGLRVFRAEALMQSERGEEAEDDLRAVLTAEPQHPQAVKLLANLLMKERRWKEALPVLDRAEFILAADPDIATWLREAESKAAAEAPEGENARSIVFSDETAERIHGLTSLPGVQAVSISDKEHIRRFGPDAPSRGGLLDSLQPLENQMASLLHDIGFGALKEASLHCGESRLIALRGSSATMRVVTDDSVREGLVHWHCAKILGENPE